MKISKISIKDFLGIKSLDLPLNTPINLIVGENEVGKSSIRDAVQWCLTGQARGLKTHQEQGALVRMGGKAAEVSITLADGHTITRRKTPKSPSTLSGKVPGNVLLPAGVLCDPYNFLSFPDNQRRELLFKLIPGLNPTTSGVAKRIAEWLQGNKIEINPKVNEESKVLVDLAVRQGFAVAESEAITRRRAAKRLRESFEQVQEPDSKCTIGDRTYSLPEVNQQNVTKGIQDLKHQRDELTQKKGAYKAYQQQVAMVEANLANAKLGIPKEPDPKKVENLERQLKEREAVLAEIQAKIEQGEGYQELFPETCPAIRGAELPCPQAGKVGFDRPGLTKDEINKLNGDRSEQEKLVANLRKSVTEAREKVKDYADALAQIQALIQGLEGELSSLKTQAPAQPDHDLDAEIARIDQRINTGQLLLAAAKQFCQQQEQANEAQQRLTSLDREVKLYDSLAKALAAEGIPSQMIADALGPFNDLLAIAGNHLFPGRRLALTRELNIELSGSPYITLSKSAKFRVGIAFQYALAKAAGARLLMIDEADILDPANRASLVGFLAAIKNDFDTILVFATSNQAIPSPDPDIQVWWIVSIWPNDQGWSDPATPKLFRDIRDLGWGLVFKKPPLAKPKKKAIKLIPPPERRHRDMRPKPIFDHADLGTREPNDPELRGIDPGHPMYYLLGGRSLQPEEIEPDRDWDLPPDTKLSRLKNPKKREMRLLEMRREYAENLRKAIEHYLEVITPG